MILYINKILPPWWENLAPNDGVYTFRFFKDSVSFALFLQYSEDFGRYFDGEIYLSRIYRAVLFPLPIRNS